MAKKIQAIRGMHDTLPEQTPRWQHVEKTIADLLKGYGYDEIRMPIVEMTDLFCRSIGEVTDIVEKEMYSFEDRNGDSLTLRPEGTASCVRACMEHGLLHNQMQKVWYKGPMFRHERPQKGRYRQFHQVGVETFGMAGPDIDAELICMTARLWPALGLNDIKLELNSLGSSEARANYREKLVEYYTEHQSSLDEDSQRRLSSNPMRILDSKNPDMQALNENAPKLVDYLDADSKQHFERLRELLDAAGVEYTINPRLVRGLDYYCKTVFEWVTDKLGAQGTVCAGGRFDGLVEQLGGKPVAASGFAMGLERLIALLEDNDVAFPQQSTHAYLVMFGDEAEKLGFQLAEQMRSEVPNLKLVMNCNGGSFKSQFKRADKSNAKYAIIIGEDEINNGTVSLKNLREKSEQQTVQQSELAEQLNKIVRG